MKRGKVFRPLPGELGEEVEKRAKKPLEKFVFMSIVGLSKSFPRFPLAKKAIPTRVVVGVSVFPISMNGDGAKDVAAGFSTHGLKIECGDLPAKPGMKRVPVAVAVPNLGDGVVRQFQRRFQ